MLTLRVAVDTPDVEVEVEVLLALDVEVEVEVETPALKLDAAAWACGGGSRTQRWGNSRRDGQAWVLGVGELCGMEE
jgi:hypothetical protein